MPSNNNNKQKQRIEGQNEKCSRKVCSKLATFPRKRTRANRDPITNNKSLIIKTSQITFSSSSSIYRYKERKLTLEILKVNYLYFIQYISKQTTTRQKTNFLSRLVYKHLKFGIISCSWNRNRSILKYEIRIRRHHRVKEKNNNNNNNLIIQISIKSKQIPGEDSRLNVCSALPSSILNIGI